MKTKIL